MGTKIQSKTYTPGSCSVMGLNNNVGMWALYHEERTLKNGQNLSSLLTRPAVGGYLQYEKEKVRQTILKHESIFRQQIQELHRLYRRQRDLMNENGQTELHKRLIPAEALPSGAFLPHFSSEQDKRTGHLSLDLTFRPSTLEIGSNHLLLSSINGRSMPNSFPSPDQTSSNDLEYISSKFSPRKMFDLELPVDAHKNCGAEQLEGKVCPESGGGICSLHRNDVPCNGYASGFPGVLLNFGHHGHTLGSNLYAKRTCDLTYLNEPIQAEQMSIAAPAKSLNSLARIKEEIPKHDVSSNSNAGLHGLCPDFRLSTLDTRDGGMYLSNGISESQRNGKEQLKYHIRAEETRCNNHSSKGVASCSDDLPRMLKSSHFDRGKADEPCRWKRTIFGVEIFEEDHVQSFMAANAPAVSHQNDQFRVTNSKTSSVLPWRITSCTLDQNVKSTQRNHFNTICGPSKRDFNLLAQVPEYAADKIQPNSHLRISNSCQGEIFLVSPSDAKQLQSFHSEAGYNVSSGTNTNSAPEQFVQNGAAKYSCGSDCEVKSFKEMKTWVSSLSFQDDTAAKQEHVSTIGPRKLKNLNGSLPWLTAKQCVSNEQDRGKKTFYDINLNYVQNCPQQLSKDPDELSGNYSTSLACAHDSEEIAEVGCLSTRKILGFPIIDTPQVSRDLTSVGSSSKEICVVPDVQVCSYRKDLTGDINYGGQPKVEDLVAEKGLNNHMIDLNLSLDEDEVPPVPCLPRAIVKIATNDIDLEVPAFHDADAVVTPEVETAPKKCEMPSIISQDESKEAYEELVRVAAEAIIAISSSKVSYTCVIDAIQPLEASSVDCLQWFAQLVVSNKCEDESKVRECLMTTDGTCNEGFTSNGLDYFEYMTLQLEDTKEEEHFCKKHVSKDQEDEETSAAALPKRPRRGQGRRGRQRKDFQRDILPGLVSLSRHEVTEDLKTMEELFSATGCTWQSSLSQRNTAKTRRGKRRLTSPLAASAVCTPPAQQPSLKEVGLEEINLTGWGKRTRRLPRQRCPNGNHAIALHC